MIIDCISDLHGYYPELEGGDLLIVAGDLTANHSSEELLDFLRWFKAQAYTKKVLIAGNHDTMLVGPWPAGLKGPFREDKAFYDFDYLCDSGTEFIYTEPMTIGVSHGYTTKSVKIWGSPWTNTFDGINPKCTAFTGDEKLLASKFALIPDDIDILVTHGPPYGVLDEVQDWKYCEKKWVGSKSLLETIKRIRPKLHIYGHIHEGYGQIQGPDTLFVNCSHVNEHYEPVNKPIRIVL